MYLCVYWSNISIMILSLICFSQHQFIMNIISYIELTYRTVLYIYPFILLEMGFLDPRIYVFNFDKSCWVSFETAELIYTCVSSPESSLHPLFCQHQWRWFCWVVAIALYNCVLMSSLWGMCVRVLFWFHSLAHSFQPVTQPKGKKHLCLQEHLYRATLPSSPGKPLWF